MAHASVVADLYLVETIAAIPAVVEVFGDRVAVDEQDAKQAAAGPYITIARWPDMQTSFAIGVGPTSWTFTYDVAGWIAGEDVRPIIPPMDAVDEALTMNGATLDGYLISVFIGADLPPAPPARLGEQEARRLGKSYQLFLSRA